mmetsp:Transcript_6992/g.10536  ORF Transcript_6992/g.10536 Transcript_6992/m.10536 type:complete len:594 (-) Transcript_6992:813-2594(-)
MDISAKDNHEHIELGIITDRLFDESHRSNSNAAASSYYGQQEQQGDVNRSYFSLHDEFMASLRLMADARLNILFICGPFAFVGGAMGLFGEALCFCLAGLALIPCAERLSFVTEQVAEHTNETIGALLNATFGNAPEFLISSAALRSGFYRVVQLTLLGSMLTNLLFVFGISCFIGGLQWQVQEIRITSGNVSIAMLLTATMGLVLPAALKLGNESISSESMHENRVELTDSDIAFSRINALIMTIGYVCYLIFQLGSHKEEFDYNGDEYSPFGGGHNIVRTMLNPLPVVKKPTMRRNKFCQKHCFLMKYCPTVDHVSRNEPPLEEVENFVDHSTHVTMDASTKVTDPQCARMKNTVKRAGQKQNSLDLDCGGENISNEGQKTVTISLKTVNGSRNSDADEIAELNSSSLKSHCSDAFEEDQQDLEDETAEIMSMRMGLVWLGIITTAISILSDILVETIDGFAARSPMSEVFVSVIIIPFFSNIAEQVSAVIFAYKNKMDLCIGVTVGSAIQIGQFVMPGCVLVGWIMDKNMTLYFRGYETICLLLGVLCVAAVLQGGTTNWLTGIFFVSVYCMISAGFAYHEREDLSITEE